jgi:hypothetical protein
MGGMDAKCGGAELACRDWTCPGINPFGYRHKLGFSSHFDHRLQLRHGRRNKNIDRRANADGSLDQAELDVICSGAK